MLHIILLILKIIGMILAALVGILLVLAFVVLFVPIGYSARLDNRKKILIKASAWWLFHGIHLSFGMDGVPSEENGNKPVIKVQILGIPIVDTGRTKEEKKAETKEEAEIREKNEEKGKNEEAAKLPVTEEAYKQKQYKEEEEPQLTIQELPAVKETAEKEEKEKKYLYHRKKEKKKDLKKKVLNKLNSITDAVQKLREKVELFKRFLQNEENIQGIKKIFSSLKGILKHLLPNKIKGQVKIGLDDPCATGYLLGVLAVFYPYYGKNLTIEPDFSRLILEGDLYLKGHIQVFTLCVIGIKLCIDANVRMLIRNFRKLKEEL